MPYGPGVALADIMFDEETVSIVRRHLPGVLDEPELRLLPFTTLGDLPGFIRAAGKAIPDTTPMWRELAAFGTGPAPLAARETPSLLSTEYESPQVQRASARLRAASATEPWGIAELMVDGPSHGNPFVDVELHAIFCGEGKEVLVGGFYDGEGTYRVRFHPLSSGTWTLVTRSNARSLDGLTGPAEVSPHSAGNHGRVVVRDAYAQPGGGPRADEQPQLRPCKPLVDEFAERFRGVSAEDVDTLMQSFLFKNCSKRIELADTLAAYA